MSWSKIRGTELELEAYLIMNENEINGCEYHNNTHIEDMYEYLQCANVPYDEALDWAVMFHDVVYDNKPEKEKRSANLFFEMNKNYRGCNLDINGVDRVQFLIMETENHKVTKDVYLKGSSDIIRADLHALTNKINTTQNFVKIMNESITLYDCSIEEFASNNIKFMSSLHQRMALNILEVDDGEKQFFYDVQKGIDLTIRLAQAIKDIK